MVRPVLVALATVLTVFPVHAQSVGDPPADPPSRRALLVAERRAKAEVVEPPRRKFIERMLFDSEQRLLLQKVSAGYGGFRLASGGLPTGSGVDLGLGYFREGVGVAYPHWDTPDRVDFELWASYSTRRARQAQARVELQNIGGSRFNLTAHGQIYSLPERAFFGRGPDSLENLEAEYSMSGTMFGGDLWYRPREPFRIGVGWHRLSPETGPARGGDEPSVESNFLGADLPGFGADAAFGRAEFYVELDARDNPDFPRAGGLYFLRVSDYDDLDQGPFSFRRYYLHLQRYLPIQQRQKVFALRALTVLTDPAPGAEVPFYFWPTLGGGQRMRGVESNRFADRNLVLFSAEYRWEIWWSLDAALFMDVGNVAAARGDLFHDMKSAFGFGLRLHTLEAFIVGTDIAWGVEGLAVHASVTYPFRLGGLIE